MSYFDLYYILTSVMLVCQAVVYLQIARENLIIFIEEHINQKLSKNLDWKNRGMETKSKMKSACKRSGEEKYKCRTCAKIDTAPA